MGETLSIFSEAPDGVPLSELLAGLEFKTISLSSEELLELSSSIVTALATMHECLPTIAHGAVTPAHIVLQRDGSVVLTGAVFVDALQALQRSREHLWRDFGIALPMSASAARFDQRGDVSQLGAVVLAIMQGRSLRRDEYPKNTQDTGDVGERGQQSGDRIQAAHLAAGCTPAARTRDVRVGRRCGARVP